MKAAVLFSGGKDSCLALHHAREQGIEVSCLIHLLSDDKESYMFHTPNAELTTLQAQAIGIPLIRKTTAGKKEEELADLRDAIKEAQQKYDIDAIISGAVMSTYQASRIQRICHELGLWSLNPLWQMNQVALINAIINAGFTVHIVGIFAYPLEQEWLGRIIDTSTITEFAALGDTIGFNPAGEGGEYETFVSDGPCFKSRITFDIKNANVTYDNHAGTLTITDGQVVQK